MFRVLVVEDSPAMRTFVRAALEEGPEEIEVHEATSGFDALRLLPRGSFGLIITDINMPDINGLELLKFVRSGAQYRDTVVLVISTMSSERDRKQALALGADGFLAKPFSPEMLRDAVAKCLQSHGGGAARPEAT
jgi:two-component system chemotaxis response regulator CheY